MNFKLAVIVVIQITAGIYSAETTSNPNQVVINLLIADARHKYNSTDKEKLYEFWSTQILDVNRRFETLVNTKVQINVVDILIREEEGFRNGRLLAGDWADDTLDNFSLWLIQNGATLPQFNIAVLVPFNSWIKNPARVNVGSLCRHNGELSTAVVFEQDPKYNKDFISHLTTSIAQMLGAQADGHINPCNNTEFAMGTGVTPASRFYFSFCTDVDISEYLNLEESQCVFSPTPNSTNVLQKYANMQPPTMDEQCRAAESGGKVNNFAGQESTCVTATCYKQIEGNTTSFEKFEIFPLDNTPCDLNSHCFRGKCLYQGFQLENVGVRRCLKSDDRFQLNDQPIMTNCNSSPTLLDSRLRADFGSNNTNIKVLYSPMFSAETLDKCLTANESTSFLQFKTCPQDHYEQEWSFVESSIGGERQEDLLLFHHVTKTWAFVQDDGTPATTTTLKILDRKFRWRVNIDFLIEPMLDSMFSKLPSLLINPGSERLQAKDTEEDLNHGKITIERESFLLPRYAFRVGVPFEILNATIN